MRVPFFLLGFSVIFSGLAGAEPEAPGGDAVHVLPPYPVHGNLTLRRPESWRHVQIGEFEVLSNADEKTTKEFATNFWQFQGLFREIFPLVKNVPQIPITLVLCGGGGKFDELVTGAKSGTNSRLSYLAGDADEGVIVVDLEHPPEPPPAGMSVADVIIANFSNEDTGSLGDDKAPSGALDAQQMLSREYVHFLLSRFEPRPPVWFAEGLAQLYSRMRIEGDSYHVENVDAALAEFFSQKPLMPFDKFFAVRYDSPEFLHPVNAMFPAQSFALVHLGLYRSGGKYQKPLLELARRANREPVTEKVFKEVFGFGYNDMALRIRGHVDGVSYTSHDMKLPADLTVPPLELRDATDAEVGRIKGDVLRLEGRLDPARLELLSPYLRGNSDPRLLASIGLLDRADQNAPVAKKYLALATDAKVALPGPYIYLVEMRLAEMAAPGAAPLTAAQTTDLLRLLGTAARMNPPRADVYRLLADVWVHSEVPPKPENLAVLDEVVRAYPHDTALLYAAGCAELRAGQKPKAASLAEQGLKFAKTEDVRRQFAELKTQAAP